MRIIGLCRNILHSMQQNVLSTSQVVAKPFYASISSALQSPSICSYSLSSNKKCYDPVLGQRTNGKSLVTPSCVTVQSVRTIMRKHYRPSAWKRYNKHNLEKRLTSPGGLEVLWRRVLKGRHVLAPYERILPNTEEDGRILASHQHRYQKHALTRKRLPKPGLWKP